jgi:hypothetical protein
MRAALPFLLLAAAVAAQQGLAGVVRTIDGAVIDGALRVEDGNAVVATANGEQRFEAARILAFEPAGIVAAPTPAPHRTWLRSGAELPCVAIRGSAAADGRPAAVRLTLPSGVLLDVPLTMVRAIRQGGAERPEPALFQADLREPPASEDLLYVVKDGTAQRSVVTIAALANDRIDFTLRGSAYDFAWSGVAAIVFGANTGLAPDRQGKPRTSLALTTGEMLDGRLLALDATVVRCRLDEGAVVEIPSAKLLSLQIASDRMAWLTELTPKVEQTPAFDRVWPVAIDRTPVGPGLVLGGKTFRRGLCVVPRAVLTYDLGGRFDRFEATIGIDDRAGPEAHAIFRVRVDGRVVWESTPRMRGLPPEDIRIELGKAKTLGLEVDFGKNYDLGDLCVWADARVVQQ